VAEFPHEMTAFKTVLSSVAEYNSLRMKLTADMADSAQRVKALVIKVSAMLLFALRFGDRQCCCCVHLLLLEVVR
jgi:Ciliary BBSome complex subunit 2, C-terminal